MPRAAITACLILATGLAAGAQQTRTPTFRTTVDLVHFGVAVVDKQGKLWIVGDPQQVKAMIEAQAEAAGADEVMVTTTAWDHELRLRSYRLLAQAFGLAA